MEEAIVNSLWLVAEELVGTGNVYGAITCLESIVQVTIALQTLSHVF
jgi:hypothetical protein